MIGLIEIMAEPHVSDLLSCLAAGQKPANEPNVRQQKRAIKKVPFAKTSRKHPNKDWLNIAKGTQGKRLPTIWREGAGALRNHGAAKMSHAKGLYAQRQKRKPLFESIERSEKS